MKHYSELVMFGYCTQVPCRNSGFHLKHYIIVYYIVFRWVNIVLSGFIIVLGHSPVRQSMTAI